MQDMVSVFYNIANLSVLTQENILIFRKWKLSRNSLSVLQSCIHYLIRKLVDSIWKYFLNIKGTLWRKRFKGHSLCDIEMSYSRATKGREISSCPENLPEIMRDRADICPGTHRNFNNEFWIVKMFDIIGEYFCVTDFHLDFFTCEDSIKGTLSIDFERRVFWRNLLYFSQKMLLKYWIYLYQRKFSQKRYLLCLCEIGHGSITIIRSWNSIQPYRRKIAFGIFFHIRDKFCIISGCNEKSSSRERVKGPTMSYFANSQNPSHLAKNLKARHPCWFIYEKKCIHTSTLHALLSWKIEEESIYLNLDV